MQIDVNIDVAQFDREHTFIANRPLSVSQKERTTLRPSFLYLSNLRTLFFNHNFFVYHNTL